MGVKTVADAMEANAQYARSGIVAWPDCTAWRPKSMFDLYYKLQRVVERHDWEAFHGSLRRPLPITFRIVASMPQAFRLEGESILERWARTGTGTRKLGLLDGWQLHLDKHQLRYAEAGSEEASVRDWLIRGTDAGHLIRQEVASMLPGALVDVQTDSKVLDLCAAPGSKTTQLVERLGGARMADGGGVVVANDASALRAYTLVKRTASLGARAASLIVTCHRGQCMPTLPGAGARGGGGYDRIICDVPCTGDGTTRKHPEVFARWEVALALRQHPLQLQIALRGAALLDVGGRMVYSTCSLNPIENEAVVAELLRRCGGALQLLDGAHDVATALAGGCAAGMTQWPVLDFGLNRVESYAELQHRAHARPATTAAGSAGDRRGAGAFAGERRLYMRSMWPPSAAEAHRLQLQRCARLLPHVSDSGGFFVALLTKVRPLALRPPPAWPRRETPPPVAPTPTTAPPTAPDVPMSAAHKYVPLPAKQSAALAKSTPLSKEQRTCLYARGAAASRIVYLTPSAARCVGDESQLRVVHAGATVFRRKKRRRATADAGGAEHEATPEAGVLLG